MAPKKYYAWSDIVCTNHLNDERNSVKKFVVKCGTEVTKDLLKVEDTGWNQLIATKAIREIPYPVDTNTTNPISPVNHYRKLAKQIEENVDDGSLMDSVLPPLPEQATTSEEVAA